VENLSSLLVCTPTIFPSSHPKCNPVTKPLSLHIIDRFPSSMRRISPWKSFSCNSSGHRNMAHDILHNKMSIIFLTPIALQTHSTPLFGDPIANPPSEYKKPSLTRVFEYILKPACGLCLFCLAISFALIGAGVPRFQLISGISYFFSSSIIRYPRRFQSSVFHCEVGERLATARIIQMLLSMTLWRPFIDWFPALLPFL